MAFEGSDQPSHTSDNILGWLEDSASFIPSGFNEPNFMDEFNSSYHWWDWDQTPEQAENPRNTNQTDEEITDLSPDCVVITPQLQPPPDQSERNGTIEETRVVKRPPRKRKSVSKSTGNSSKNGDKDGRWAEQLLNPCATAIMTGNSSRVQHYIYVLRELASYTGDSNRRLAAYGLRALTRHLSSSSSSSPEPLFTFASAEPKTLQQSLLRFYEVSPWFAFPNSVANSAILQILAQEGNGRNGLHILDIGVSHGMQWPTLLEALARRPEGPPPKVHITILSTNTSNDRNTEIPFSVGPPAHSYISQLHSFARSLNINLQISELDSYLIQDLSTQIINASAQETLIVCAQFRLHQLNHSGPDERTCFLKRVRRLEPRGVVLSENNTNCSCSSCGDFATGFSKQLDYLWKFLDSTSSGFKGQECEERSILEGEAAKALMSKGEMNEGKDKWYTRMRRAGFETEAIAEEAIDRARSLLKKYDNNWEMRVEDEDTSIQLSWKGESVSFCSLWKVDHKVDNS